MTPFGAKLRDMRAQRGITLKDMAADLQISAAFLSALEHGKRGRPSPILVRQICGFFHIIWEDAEDLERLARISHPRVVVGSVFNNRTGPILYFSRMLRMRIIRCRLSWLLVEAPHPI